MSRLTRHDADHIAAALTFIRDLEDRSIVAEELAIWLNAYSARFDRTRFLTLCELREDQRRKVRAAYTENVINFLEYRSKHQRKDK